LSSGIGACGLVAQLLSTVQSVGRTRVTADGSAQPDPAFSLQLYFVCVCTCSALSLASFGIIHKRMFRLRGEGWVRHALGAEQPAAGVAHLLRVENDELQSFAAASEEVEHAGGAKHYPGTNDMTNADCHNSSSMESCNVGCGGSSRSINPSQLMRSLSASERSLCAVLACNCFMMFALPGSVRYIQPPCSHPPSHCTGLLPFMCGTADNRFTVMQWLYFVYFLGSVLGRAAVALRQFHSVGSLTACSSIAWLVLTTRVFIWSSDSTNFAAGVVMLCVAACTVSNGIVSTMAFCMVASEGGAKILGLFNQAGALSGAVFAIIAVRTVLV
jgi:hypothetical protein